MKKVLSIVLALCLLMTIGAFSAMAEGKTVINVMSFTDEVPNMITKYLEAHPEAAEKYEINTTIIATTDGLYQPALDQALANNEADIYCAESAFVLKYCQGDACEYAAAYEDLGIDPTTKTLLFSDSLNFEKADMIREHFDGKAKVAFGIGTFLSNDTNVSPLNIVMKTTACNGQDVAKISDTPGKGMCKNPEYVNYLQRSIEWRMHHTED